MVQTEAEVSKNTLIVCADLDTEKIPEIIISLKWRGGPG
jgi:hypothetical protein